MDGEQGIIDVGLYGSDISVVFSRTHGKVEMFSSGLGFRFIRFQNGLPALITGRNFMGNKIIRRREIIFVAFRERDKPGCIAVTCQFVKRFFIFVGGYSKQVGNIHPI